MSERKPPLQNWHDEQMRKARLLYRIVHGNSEFDSDLEFACLNPSIEQGWLRLANKLKKVKLRI